MNAESWKLMLNKYSFPEEATRPFGAHFFPYGYGRGFFELPYGKGKAATAIGHAGAGNGSSDFMVKIINHDRIIVLWNNEFLNPIPMELFEELSKL